MTVTKEARAIEQARCEQENVAFHKWWEESGHAADPIFTLTMENCAHSAWQYRAALSSRSAEAGKPVVKGLDWRCLYPESTKWPKIWHGKGVMSALYACEQYGPGYGWVGMGGSFPTLEDAKAAAQADYEARVLSALSTPADREPFRWMWEKDLVKSGRWSEQYDDERPAEHPQVRNIRPLYAAPVADGEPASVPDTERLAQSLTNMITEWVEGGIKGGTDWRNGLSSVILARIQRLTAASQPNPSAVDAEMKRLRKALAPFAKLAKNYSNFDAGDAVFAKGCAYVYELREAEAALASEGKKP